MYSNNLRFILFSILNHPRTQSAVLYLLLPFHTFYNIYTGLGLLLLLAPSFTCRASTYSQTIYSSSSSLFTISLNFRQFLIWLSSSSSCLHFLSLYPYFIAPPTFPHFILDHCFLSLPLTPFCFQYLSSPTVSFLLRYSGQYVDLSIRHQSSWIFWSFKTASYFHSFRSCLKVFGDSN